MTHTRRTISALPMALLLCASGARPLLAQADPGTVARIVDEGKNHNQVMKHLTYLTKKIGPRLTSSPQLDKAYQWTMRKFRDFGCKNVHLEEWGTYPLGFERGKRQIGRMVAPETRDFQFTSPSWTPGTNGRLRGNAVAEPTTMEEFERVKESLKGAWLLSAPRPRQPRGTPPPEPTEVEKAVAASGFAGRVTGSNDELVITSGRYNVEWEKLPTTPSVTIRKSDMDAVREKLAAGQPVELEFDIQQRVFKGPRKNYNVVAEIPGTEKPDEVVIVSGHLDSWDGPGSEGAQDNGTGTMVALEAARILNKVGAKPKRTIRFILWTGEEQGLFGSLGYVKDHKDELGKISAVFVDDGGTNYQGGLLCTPEMEPIIREALTPAMDAFPEMPITIRTASKLSRMSGSDHYPFVAAGVPGFFWNESGRGNYREVHHTQNDKLETAIPEYLVQSSTNSAAAAYIVACAPTLLPREAASQPTTPPTPSGGRN